MTDSIIELLATRGKAHDEFSLKSERTRLATFQIPALRARLADLQVKAGMAGQSVQSLKALVAGAHADKRKFPGFPELPRQIWDGTRHVNVDAAYLKASDPFALKKFCRLYSVEQVSQRLAEG